MASSKMQLQLLTVLLTLSATFHLSISCITAIFSFGDSLADTGNYFYELRGRPLPLANPPFGETYFHRPTGRYSDGRLVVDFIAQALGVPLVPPFLAGSSGQNFRRGVNFAVSGASALDNEIFIQKGLTITWTNYSLGNQVESFKQLLPSMCFSASDCKKMLSTSLFLVGEIGGNDYNFLFFGGRKLAEIQAMVPQVISSISSKIRVLIGLGARILVVPGNFPFGCMPAYLTTFRSPITRRYDPKTGCLNWLNAFTENHNRQLQAELGRLRKDHPQTTIIYADYYQAAMSIFQSPNNLGFNKAPLVACCGGGGPYNADYTVSTVCGAPRAVVCKDPSSHVSWDGVHPTEAANKVIAQSILQGPHASPPIASLSHCP